MHYVTVVTQDGTSYRQDIADGTLRVGRSSDADLALRDDRVSRLHAEIVRVAEGFLLADVRSKNGTFLNGRRITEPVLLRPGDRIGVGESILVFDQGATVPLRVSEEPLLADPEMTIVSVDDWNRTDASDDTGARAVPRRTGGPKPRMDLGGTGHLVSEVNRRLFFHRPLVQILEEVMDIAREAVSYERGLLVLLRDGQPVVEVRRLPPEETAQDIPVSRTILDRVLGDRESVLTVDALGDERFKSSSSIGHAGVRSIMCVPLADEDKVIGLIYVDSRKAVGLFDESTLRHLTFLANLAAEKIENARLFQEAAERRRMGLEFREAAAIQTQLLPLDAPRIPGYVVMGTTLACHEVGGDYYDYVLLPDGRLAFVVADVAGKGLPAAMLMANFQAGFRLLSGLDLSLDRTIEALNRHLSRSVPANRYVALFYGVLDPVRHSLRYVNAGQVPPFLMRRNRSAERLELTGLPLGCFPEVSFQVASVAMDPGDLLVCCSDGVTEARDPAESMFGEERLVDAARHALLRSPSDVLGTLLSALEGHCGICRYQDDVTLLVLRRSE